MTSKPTDEQLKQAIDAIFLKYDTDKSQSLEFAEVKNVINDAFNNMKNPKPVTDEDVKKFLGAVDQNSDGKITKSELFNIFKRIIDSHYK